MENWRFYQFQYRDGEIVVACRIRDNKQWAFYVLKSGDRNQSRAYLYNHDLGAHCYLLKSNHRVQVSVQNLKGLILQEVDHFYIRVNGKSSIKMAGSPAGYSVGHESHWSGKWTPFSYDGLVSFMTAYLQYTGKESPYSLKTYIAPDGHTRQELEEGVEPVSDLRAMMTIIQLKQGAKIVALRFSLGEGASVYHFKNVIGERLKVGDQVVVEGNGHQAARDFAIATVVDPDVRPDMSNVALGALKRVVAKVVNDRYLAAIEAENNAAHALALSDVTERLDKFKEQVGEDAFKSATSMLSAPMIDITKED